MQIPRQRSHFKIQKMTRASSAAGQTITDFDRTPFFLSDVMYLASCVIVKNFPSRFIGTNRRVEMNSDSVGKGVERGIEEANT